MCTVVNYLTQFSAFGHVVYKHEQILGRSAGFYGLQITCNQMYQYTQREQTRETCNLVVASFFLAMQKFSYHQQSAILSSFNRSLIDIDVPYSAVRTSLRRIYPLIVEILTTNVTSFSNQIICNVELSCDFGVCHVVVKKGKKKHGAFQ